MNSGRILEALPQVCPPSGLRVGGSPFGCCQQQQARSPQIWHRQTVRGRVETKMLFPFFAKMRLSFFRRIIKLVAEINRNYHTDNNFRAHYTNTFASNISRKYENGEPGGLAAIPRFMDGIVPKNDFLLFSVFSRDSILFSGYKKCALISAIYGFCIQGIFEFI